MLKIEEQAALTMKKLTEENFIFEGDNKNF